MTCERCQGLMVVDHFIDMQDGGGSLWLRAWRCMNCGDIVDPAIIRHRLARSSPLAGFIKRCAKTCGKRYEVIPIGV